MSVLRLVNKYKDTEIFKAVVERLSGDLPYCEDEGLYCEEDYEEQFYDLDKTGLFEEIRTGATKVCVLLRAFVLKAGFTSEMVYDDCDEYEDERDEFDYYRQERDGIDYCELEAQVYEEAVKEGLEEFFAETVQVADKVYAQEYCERTIDEDYYDGDCKNMWTSFAASDYACRKLGFNKWGEYCDPNTAPAVIPEIVLYYWVTGGKSWTQLRRLAKFLSRHHINDLHRGNIGWVNGELKLFDYSGYNSGTENTFD